MKLPKILLLLSVCFFISCDNFDCPEDVFGVWNGRATIGSSNSDFDISIRIDQAADGSVQIDEPIIESLFPFSGNLAEDCSSIEVPEQTVISGVFQANGTIEGFFTIADGNMTGSLTTRQTNGIIMIEYNYDLSR